MLELPDDDPVAFSHFQLWLYTGNILESHESAKDIDWPVLLDIYLFGDVRGIPGLQNKAIDVFIDKNVAMNQIPNSLLRRIYENTFGGSPLRKLLVDMMTFNANLTDSHWFDEKKLVLYPQEFLIDLAKSLYKAWVGTKTMNINFGAVRSNYYVCDDGKKKVSCYLHCCHHFQFHQNVL